MKWIKRIFSAPGLAFERASLRCAAKGLNKAETAAQYGDEQVLIWRRAYAIAPNPLPEDSPMNPANDPRYANVPKENC